MLVFDSFPPLLPLPAEPNELEESDPPPPRLMGLGTVGAPADAGVGTGAGGSSRLTGIEVGAAGSFLRVEAKDVALDAAAGLTKVETSAQGRGGGGAC